MKRNSLLIALLVTIPIVAFTWWIASNTTWTDITVPMPLQGEARTNPFYAAQRFAGALGARTAWDRIFTTPPPGAVIVLSSWQWNLSTRRTDALERWVESGGRLVVDRTLEDEDEEFERWSGIVWEYPDEDDDDDENEDKKEDRIENENKTEAVKEKPAAAPANKPAKKPAPKPEKCRKFQEERDGLPVGAPETTTHAVCDVERWSVLTTKKLATWALRDADGMQAVRVQVGRGSVTVINATPFTRRALLDGDHGWLFVAATQLRRGDEVHFLSEDAHLSLLALIWLRGGPAVALALALIALLLWRGGVRFGPLAAPQQAARRSLAEQIRGTGQFALRHGGGDALHAACVRALEETAQRRIKRYALLSPSERAEALARLTGFNGEALVEAMQPRPHTNSDRSHDVRRTIARLEAARRHILMEHTRSSHGTR